MNEKGIAHIIMVALLLVFVVAILVSAVVGLNQMQEQQFSQSLFNKDAKIHPILQNIKEQKKELESEVSKMRDRYENSRSGDEEEKASAHPTIPKTPEERLSNVEVRLGSESRQ